MSECKICQKNKICEKAKHAENYRTRGCIDFKPEYNEIEHTIGYWEPDPDEKRGDGAIYDYRCSICKSKAHEGPYGNNDNCPQYCPYCDTLMKL